MRSGRMRDQRSGRPQFRPARGAHQKPSPLAAGRVSVREALLLFAALVVCAVLVVLPLRSWLLGGLCVAALFLAVSYPFTKRFLAVPQAYLGVAFGFGIPMAYAAQLGSVPAEAWWLLLANVFWAIAYDTEYAMVDRADDLKLGIRTSAITFGRAEVAAVMLCYARWRWRWWGMVGRDLGLGAFFYGGLVVAAGIAGYHYTLIRERDPARCFQAFRHNKLAWRPASFAGIALDFLFSRGISA
jgi:4-hydroxybenzoate polyprenyltransferase